MEEKKLVVCRKHWITFVVPVLIGTVLLFMGFIGIVYVRENFGIFFSILLIGIGILAHAYFSYKTTYIILTNKRVIVRQGIILPRVHAIPRLRVLDVAREYTALGVILGYRTIKIKTWGESGSEVCFKYMTKANEFASELTGQTDEEIKHLIK